MDMNLPVATHRFETSWGAIWSDGSARFRVWAPQADEISVRLAGRDHAMERRDDGWRELTLETQPGEDYALVLPDGLVVPDPASRAQAGDVHGPSRLVDPAAYEWRADWSGRPWEEAVVYEMHVGTFTAEGTFAAAIDKLDHLVETGITALEIMPVAHFAGTRGWGYDGVLLYAPHSAYGRPEDLKALVDAAHERGLMVLLDVVYNHFGPDGNYLHSYAEDFFHDERQTPWGPAIAYDRAPVRRFFIENALYWLTEYRFDGLRLDAIDQVRDTSDPELLVEIAQQIRREIPDRPIHLTTEDNRNITSLHERGPDGGVPLHTAEWNDDFHNATHVVATGESEGYYKDFARDGWTYLARSLAKGFAFQGEPNVDGDPRGQPSGHLPPAAFVDFLQNHDQTGNRALGERLLSLADPRMVDALQAILLLSPHIPLIFMGEEWGETRPFLFFTDFHGELAAAVREGRRAEFRDFGAYADGADLDRIPDPNDPATFEASKIDWSRISTPEGVAALSRTRDLLEIRRREVRPYLSETAGGSGLVLSDAPGEVAVDWRLGGRLWQLRANLSEERRGLPPVAGRAVYVSSDAQPDDAPAFLVGFWASDG